MREEIKINSTETVGYQEQSAHCSTNQKSKENESGRSMVEMLGVLALMGVLVIGGVAGYRWAMDMYYASTTIKELNERAVVYSHQMLAEQTELSSDEFKPGDKTGLGYALKANIVEGQPFFRIELDSVPKGVCQKIVDADWYVPFSIYVNGAPDYGSGIECPIRENKMVFYFQADLNGDMGEVSASGWRPEESWMFICRRNSDCVWSSDGPLCDTDTGKCGPCRDHADCADSPRGPLCSSDTGLCFKCQTDDDCVGHPNGELCNVKTGKCGVCLTNDDCVGNVAGELCYKQDGICVKCLIDKDCSNVDPNTVCDQVRHVCTDKPQGQIMDKFGKLHDCDTSRVLLIKNAEDCSIACPNRKMQFGYCAPVCADDEWLESSESNNAEYGQPQTRCVKCDQRTGWHYGTVTSSFCGVCDERYYFADTWGSEHMCVLKDCGPGYVQCNDGCCSCTSKGNISITVGTAVGYNADATSSVWRGYTYHGIKSCEACEDENGNKLRYVNGMSCIMLACSDNEFRYGNACKSCTTTEAIYVSNDADRNACLSCVDSAGNKLRRLNGNYCILAKDCPYGTQENNPNTPEDESQYCAECPTDTFPVGNTCVPCDDPKYYVVPRSDCERCGDKRVVKDISLGTGLYGKDACLRTKKDGEFYSYLGTQSCDIEENVVVFQRPGHCSACGDKRILTSTDMGSAYTCSKTCSDNEMLTTDGCKPCDSTGRFNLFSTRDHVAENSGIVNVTTRHYCSSVCPGQRFRDVAIDGRCAKCPDGTYSMGSDATTCDGVCPADISSLTKGACLACGGTWNGASCEK